MKFVLLIVMFVIGANISCNKEERLNKSLGDHNITLNGCAEIIFSDDRLELCFEKLLEDSRCPKDAICIWAGRATCEFGFVKNGTRENFVLSIPGPNEVNIAGYNIQLLDVTPYPGAYLLPGGKKTKEALLRISK